MNFMQRYNLSTECDQVDSQPLTAEDVLQAQQEEDEINEVKGEIEADVAAVEDAEAVIEDLDEQVEKNEDVLENHPEEVTEEIVATSQEHYYNSIGRLGYKTDDMRISIESGSNSIERLRLSTEGIKDFMNKVIEKIKEIIKRITLWLKVLWQKIVMFFTRFQAKAKAQLKRLQEVPSVYKEYTDTSGELTKKHLPAMIVLEATGSSFRRLDFRVNSNPMYELVISVLDSVARDYTTLIEYMRKKREGLLDRLDAAIGITTAKDMFKSFDKLNLANNGSVKLSNDIKNDMLGYSTDGKHIKYIAFRPDDDNGNIKEGAVDFTLGQLNPSDYDLGNKSITLKLDEIRKDLETFSDRWVKNYKSVKDELDKELVKAENNMRATDKLMREEGYTEEGDPLNTHMKVFNAVAGVYRKAVGTMIPSVILDGFSYARNALVYYTAIIDELVKDNKSDKKS